MSNSNWRIRALAAQAMGKIGATARIRFDKRATLLGGLECRIGHRTLIEGGGAPCPPDLLRLFNDLDRGFDQALATVHAKAA